MDDFLNDKYASSKESNNNNNNELNQSEIFNRFLTHQEIIDIESIKRLLTELGFSFDTKSSKVSLPSNDMKPMLKLIFKVLLIMISKKNEKDSYIIYLIYCL